MKGVTLTETGAPVRAPASQPFDSNSVHRNYHSPSPRRAGISGLLERLEKVQRLGEGRWKALCPVHGDRKPSLHVTLKDDGTILVRCMSHQCGAADIVAAIGLSLADLFPDRNDHHRPGGKPRIPAGDILKLIDHETAIVEIAASDISGGFDLDDAAIARVLVASERIHAARRLYGH